MPSFRVMSFALAAAMVVGWIVGSAYAAVTITGTVGSSGKYLISGAPSVIGSRELIKITFETTSAGVNLELCGATMAEYASGTCAMSLSTSGGPDYRFLTLIDASRLQGKILFVRRAAGSASAGFALTIE